MSHTDTPSLASKVIRHATIDVYRSHQAVGDMWPTTSASDGHVYTAAGDNHDSAMNVWRVTRGPHLRSRRTTYSRPLRLKIGTSRLSTTFLLTPRSTLAIQRYIQ